MFGKKRKGNNSSDVQQNNQFEQNSVNVDVNRTANTGGAQPYQAQNTFYPNMQGFPQGFYGNPYPMNYSMPQQSTQYRQGGANFFSFNPTSYTEVAPILEKIKSRAVVLVNISKMPRDERVRIMDMISGAIYVLGGNITTVQDNMFSVTPPGSGE